MNRKSVIFTGLAISALVLSVQSPALADVTKPHVDASGANMQPAYPASALPDQEAGAVVIGALVREDGSVRQIKLQQSSGFPDLDTAAANAVRGWKFVPGMEDGKPVSAWANVQIVFTPPK
jgi:TonB family protein